MQHQSVKLQASGVDLGSDMLFGTRLGFSGTPSELMPRELGQCEYEPGSEGEVVCEPCPTGGFCSSGAVAPTLCEAGRFSGATGNTAAADCAPCPTG